MNSNGKKDKQTEDTLSDSRDWEHFQLNVTDNASEFALNTNEVRTISINSDNVSVKFKNEDGSETSVPLTGLLNELFQSLFRLEERIEELEKDLQQPKIIV